MGRQERLETTVIPVTRSIPWRPVTHSNHLVLPLLRSEQSHFRHFVAQRALIAAQEMVRPAADAGPPGCGLLTGRLHRCPRTRARFAIVDRVVALGPGPDSDLESTRTSWLRQQVEAVERTGEGAPTGEEGGAGDGRAGGGRVVIGWVRGSASIGHRLSTADEALHLRCFPRPYQVALSIGDGVGGLLAYEAKVACTFLIPFHELLERRIRDSDAAPPATAMDWVNYEPSIPVIGLRPEERRHLAAAAPAAAPPAAGLLGAAIGSLRGLMGGQSRP
ncbi:MAG: hypothetical protein ACYC2G_17010 [Gemmatimonadaceae bacterium]